MKIEVTKDKELELEIREKLRENGGYCPCRIDKNEDTRCCCLDFRNQAEGICHCGIFSK